MQIAFERVRKHIKAGGCRNVRGYGDHQLRVNDAYSRIDMTVVDSPFVPLLRIGQYGDLGELGARAGSSRYCDDGQGVCAGLRIPEPEIVPGRAGWLASTAMALAVSILEPPPTPSMTSASKRLAISAPAVMHSVVGSGSTPSKCSYSTPACDSKPFTRPNNGSNTGSVGTVTRRHRFPYWATASPSSLSRPDP